MNDQDKTKEELIKELRKENNSLKTSYDKGFAERRQSKEALIHMHDLMQYIIEHSRSAIAVHDKDLKYIYVSQRYLQDYKVKEQDVIGKHHYEVFPDLPQKWRDVHQKALAGETSSAADDSYLRDDGTQDWTCWECRPWYEANGSVGGIIIYTEIITKNKQAEEALRESEIKYRELVDNSPDAIVIYAEGKIVFVNKESLRLSAAASNEELIGKSVLEFVHPDYRALAIERMKNMITEGIVLPIVEEKFIRLDGSELDVEVKTLPIRLENKPAVQLVIRDITDRKKVEQELLTAKRKAEESDRLKTAFLNNISHEIRTPLNGILGSLSLIQSDDLNKNERDEVISIINKSANRLINTIENIVDISRIQVGQVKRTVSETNIKKLTNELLYRFKTASESQGLEFSINNHLNNNIECISTDDIKLKTILSNLIGNALKFTNAGSIVLGISKNGNYLEFSVTDTGIGISKNKQQVIFERFNQADVSNTRQFEGSGLGLSIAKAYVEMLGGKIWVESEEGKGSTFYFTIPYNTEPEEKNVIQNDVLSEGAENQINPEVSGLKILIAEDDEESAKLITIAVRKFGKEVLTARTGVEAIEVCRNNPDIDLVLMDIKMPIKDGYEATRQIRHFNKDVVIIAQTAYALAGDREKAIEAGCNDYITKPIRKNELLTLMKKYFKKQNTISIFY